MDAALDSSILSFYTAIRSDPLVQHIGAEDRIRGLVDGMIAYMDQANKVNYSLQKQRKEKIDRHLNNVGAILKDFDNLSATPKDLNNPSLKEQFEDILSGFKALHDQRSSPMVLDFRDIKAIAYTVGTYRDRRSFLMQQFTEVHPLDVVVQEHAARYENFKKTGDLLLMYFDEDIRSHMAVAADVLRPIDLRKESLIEMFHKSCSYANRQGTLLRLADKKEEIRCYYADEAWAQLKRGFLGHDWSWASAGWRDDRLSKRQMNDIAGHFRRQAEIDGIVWKTLHLACLRLRGDTAPEEANERLYQSFMDSYKREGLINAVYGPAKRQ